MKEKKHVFCVSILLTFFCIATFFAGCGQSPDNGQIQTGAAASSVKAGPESGGAEPYPISIMTTTYWPETPIPENSDVFKKIEQYANTKIDMMWVPAESYEEKGQCF